MKLKSMALAVVMACACVPAWAQEILTLEAAFERALRAHPDIEVFTRRQAGLSAEAERAALDPPWSVRGSLENALGSGESEAFRSAELSVSLASVLERGDKRAARLALAESRIDALGNARESKRLDLMAEVARRYLDALAAELSREIAVQDLAQRERAVAAATRRVAAGASPRSVQLAAQAQAARAGLDRDRAQRELLSAGTRLRLLWGESDAGLVALPTLALQIPEAPAFADIAALLDQTPELESFADEQRLREARLQLARSAATPDVEWEVGLRRLQAEADWALIGSVSIPLGSAGRALPETRAAEAELEALSFERESSERSLQATLAQAHGRLVAAAADAKSLRDSLLPLLVKAEDAAADAYAAGALSYLEWAQLQFETTLTRRQQLNATLDAQRALIEIQRLTGHDFTRVSTKELAQ